MFSGANWHHYHKDGVIIFSGICLVCLAYFADTSLSNTDYRAVLFMYAALPCLVACAITIGSALILSVSKSNSARVLKGFAASTISLFTALLSVVSLGATMGAHITLATTQATDPQKLTCTIDAIAQTPSWEKFIPGRVGANVINECMRKD